MAKWKFDKPVNWQDFEDLCFILWKFIWNDLRAQKNGRQAHEVLVISRKMLHILITMFVAYLITSCSGFNSIDSTATKNYFIKQFGMQSSLGTAALGTEYCVSTVRDSSDNIYCTGTTDGSLGEVSGGSNDAFVAKFSSEGSLIWLKQFGTITVPSGGVTNGNQYGRAIALDPLGNVYVTGTTDSSFGEASSGTTDVYIAKLSSAGTLLWVTQLGAVTMQAGFSNSSPNYCSGLAVDSSSNVICAGSTQGAMGEPAGGGTHDSIIVKLDSSGTLIWVKQLGATTTDAGGSNAASDYFEAVTTDSAGNIFALGATFGAQGEAFAGGIDIVVAKFNSSGALQWLTQLGTITKASGGSNALGEEATAIALDNSGNPVITGSTRSNMGEASGGLRDIFLAKFDSATGGLTWLKQYGSASVLPGGDTSGDDEAYALAIDSSDNIYITGYTESSLAATSDNSGDIFFGKFNSSGTPQWFTQLTENTLPAEYNTSGSESCTGLVINSSGELICTGSTDGNLNDTLGGGEDVIFVKVSPLGKIL